MGNYMDKISGKMKQTRGKLTHNKSMQAKGKIQEAKSDFDIKI